MADSLESKIDELYALPLDQFTNARNALAKTLSGDEKRLISSLAKPAVPIWAINQLYAKDRATYKALVDASEKSRTAHRAVLSGRQVDLRKPDQVHRAALERAVTKTLDLLETSGERASDATRESLRRALGALPSDETAGRLTRVPEPAGFSLFAGVTPRATATEVAVAPKKRETPKSEPTSAQKKREQEIERKARERARLEREKAEQAALAQAAARKTLKQAQQAAERATFAIRKAKSDLAKAQEAETNAANRLKNAEHRLAELTGD